MKVFKIITGMCLGSLLTAIAAICSGKLEDISVDILATDNELIIKEK